MVNVFIVKPTRKHRPTTLTVVLCCVGLEHSQLIECNTLIWEVVVETGLCKYVGTTISDVQLLGQPESRVSISFSCN